MRVRLDVLEPDGTERVIRDTSCSFPVVFTRDQYPAAWITDRRFRVETDDGREVPAEAEITSYWDEGRTFVRWMIVHVELSTDVGFLWLDTDQEASDNGAAWATQTEDLIRVDTGAVAVKIDRTAADLLTSVDTGGPPMLAGRITPLSMDAWTASPSVYRQRGEAVPDGPAGPVATSFSGKVKLALATGLRAVVSGIGAMSDDDGTDWCHVEWRLYFARGEPFVRLLHTVTWLRRDPEHGATSMALQIPVRATRAAQLRIGLDEEASVVTGLAPNFFLAQAEDHDASTLLTSTNDSGTRRLGRLSGWAQIERSRSVPLRRFLGVVLKDMWQTYPKGFSLTGQGPTDRFGQRSRPRMWLNVDLWPRHGAKPMSFRAEDVMSNGYYDRLKPTTQWNNKQHFHGGQERGGQFEQTGEGVARTHELLLSFGDAPEDRDIRTLHDLLHRPVVIRQDPVASMSTMPFLGLHIPPVTDDHTAVEEALVEVAAQQYARSFGSYDFGFWRFGSLHWNWPLSTRGYYGMYRTFDGTQYGLQMLAWLLYVRGGPRWLYDEAVRSARFAMDVGVNHITTRGVPAGFAADARSLPFPWQVHDHTHYDKKPKLYHLLAYYHLTGDERARQTAELQISGAFAQLGTLANDDPDAGVVTVGEPLDVQVAHWDYGEPRARLNPVSLWAEAAAEVGTLNASSNVYETQVRPHLREAAERWWLGVMDDVTLWSVSGRSVRQTHFLEPRGGQVYMFDGFGLQTALDPSPETFAAANDTVAAALAESRFTAEEDGGPYNVEHAVAAWWDLQHGTGMYSSVLADLAYGLADTVAVGARDNDPTPYMHRRVHQGHRGMRQYALPMLAGLAAMDLDESAVDGVGSTVTDLLMSLGTVQTDPPGTTAYIYVRHAAAQALKVELLAVVSNSRHAALAQIDVDVHEWRDGDWDTSDLSIEDFGPKPHIDHPHYDEIPARAVVWPEPGTIYRFTLTTRETNTTRRNYIRVGAHSQEPCQIVHGLPQGRFGLTNLDSLSHRAVRLYLKPPGDSLSIAHPIGEPVTLRGLDLGSDLSTPLHEWSILHQTRLDTPWTATVPLPPNLAMVALTTSGEGGQLTLSGAGAYASSSATRFFTPPDV